ncbi:exlusion protein FxsA [Vibrio cholerae]|nr:exlusion protein FxsA [Vibrio cholerae]TQP54724.1 exlusion protein FxsA [Vibrio cholerae]TQP95460.1 exlusion protein FxsA [Vibrio cholerae]
MSTRSVSSPSEPQWLQLLCLSLVVMRCQPLRRALAIWSKYVASKRERNC